MSDTDQDALLSGCQREIERAWNNARDVSVLHRLAAAHPEIEKELYDFFADVIEAEDDYDRPRPEYAEMARKARTMVRRSASGDLVWPRTFLGLLMDEKKEPLDAIARSMEVTLEFLVDLSDNGKVLPLSARKELVRRAGVTPKVDEAEAIGSFDVVSTRRAAWRDRAYEASTLTYEEMVKRSGLSAEERGFWMGLA